MVMNSFHRNPIVFTYLPTLFLTLLIGCAGITDFNKAKGYYEKGEYILARQHIDGALHSKPNDQQFLKLKQDIEENIKRNEYESHISKANNLPEKDLIGRYNEYLKAIDTTYSLSSPAKIKLQEIKELESTEN
jgi:hypothetical protein